MIKPIPANSTEAERGCLGCIFLSPNEVLSECIERFKPGYEIFYQLQNQIIYQTLVEMFEAKEAIDVITVQNRLKDKGKLEEVGGIVYLAALPDTTPSAANVSHYIGILLEKYVLRKIVEHCSDTAQKTYEESTDLESLLEDFESGALAVRDSITTQNASDIKTLVKQRLEFYEECEKRGGGLLGLSTGFPDLDRMTDGMKPAEMIIIAARPSVGKTTLAMNIAENVAIDHKIPVGVFSLEMSKEALVGRMIASRSRVNERTITKGRMLEGEAKRIFTSGVNIAHSPIVIDDSGGLTITQLRAKARRMAQRDKVKLIVIDYVQLLRTAQRRQSGREEMDEVSKGVKTMAKELHVPVIVISQLNREMEKDKERKPRLSDMRESGQLEADADVVGMLYAANAEEAAMGNDVLAVNLLIAKQRNGPTGIINLTFFKKFTRFESASRTFEPGPAPKSWIQSEE